MFDFQVTGGPEMNASIGKLIVAMPKSLAAALYVWGNVVMADSKEHYVPVDTGVLRASGYVQAPVIESDKITMTLGYGGAASAYAAVQHERLDYHHTVGGPKYLELPLYLHLEELGQVLGKAIPEAVLEQGDDLHRVVYDLGAD